MSTHDPYGYRWLYDEGDAGDDGAVDVPPPDRPREVCDECGGEVEPGEPLCKRCKWTEYDRWRERERGAA